MKKSNFNFMANRKTFWLISISVFAIGIIFNVIFGTEMDISFTGGAVLKFSYSDSVVSDSDVSSDTDAVVTPSETPSGSSAQVLGAPVSGSDTSASDASPSDASPSDASGAVDIDKIDITPDYSRNIDIPEAERIISLALGENINVSLNTRISISENDTDNKNLVVTLAENKALDQNAPTIIRNVMLRKYPNITLTLKESNSVDPIMGKEFFWKCIVAVFLAALFMIAYVGFRFRKIGGWTAGASSIIAILHDALIVYFVFVIFRFPLDDNFIAVVLAIIGYSLNSTIVIFDRIRENRKLLGPKTPVAELANVSMNETLGRTINTNLCVFAAVAIVAIVSVIFGLDSIISFAVPMMFGTVSGCYSSLCISNSIWVTWQESIQKKRAMKAAAVKAFAKKKK